MALSLLPPIGGRAGIYPEWAARRRTTQQLDDLDSLWRELRAEPLPDDVHELDEVLCE